MTCFRAGQFGLASTRHRDPLCAVAGWLKLPFWPCLLYMAIGKFGRYFTMTAGMLWLWPGQFTH